MSDSRRVQRVEKELRQIIGEYLSHSLKHPMPGVLTVAQVSVNGDLRSGKVFLSFLGNNEDRAEAQDILLDQAPEIQRHIGKILRMKFIPKLKFFINQGQHEPSEIDQLIADMNAKKSN